MTPVERLLSEADRYKWQDIADAPKDGTSVLLTAGIDSHTGRWDGQCWLHTLGINETFLVLHPTYFKHLDTPSSDIVAKLSAALRVAVEYIGCETSFAAIDEALAKINAICEGK